MTRFAGMVAAAALLLPIAANAQDLPRALIQYADNSSTTAATQSAPAAQSGQPAQPAMQHRTHHAAKHQALGANDKRSLDAKERRETEALNQLQAAGYHEFSNVAPEGRDYRATVTKNGQQMVVLVNPERGTVAVVR